MRSLIVRLHIVNRELKQAEAKLDELCGDIGQTGLQSAGSAAQWDVEILRSLPGIGRINLATLLSEAFEPISHRDYQALRTLSGVAPVSNAAASPTSLRCATQRM
jgi:hypothetical protein